MLAFWRAARCVLNADWGLSAFQRPSIAGAAFSGAPLQRARDRGDVESQSRCCAEAVRARGRSLGTRKRRRTWQAWIPYPADSRIGDGARSPALVQFGKGVSARMVSWIE